MRNLCKKSNLKNRIAALGSALATTPLCAEKRIVKIITSVYIGANNTHKFKGEILRTNIVIDDKLMTLALESTGLKTKKEVVEEGLKALIKIKDQSKLKTLRGKLKWEGDINKMRTDK